MNAMLANVSIVHCELTVPTTFKGQSFPHGETNWIQPSQRPECQGRVGECQRSPPGGVLVAEAPHKARPLDYESVVTALGLSSRTCVNKCELLYQYAFYL